MQARAFAGRDVRRADHQERDRYTAILRPRGLGVQELICQHARAKVIAIQVIIHVRIVRVLTSVSSEERREGYFWDIRWS